MTVDTPDPGIPDNDGKDDLGNDTPPDVVTDEDQQLRDAPDVDIPDTDEIEDLPDIDSGGVDDIPDDGTVVP